MFTNIKKISFASLLLLSMINLACTGSDGVDGLPGADGEEGGAYIAISWVSGPFTFVASDPNIPYTIFNGQNYLTTPGSYSLAYEAWDGSQWYVTYNLYINEGEPGSPGEKGEPGSFMQDGEDGANGADGADGEDICFELSCLSIGATLYSWSCYSRAKIVDDGDRFEKEYKKALSAGITSGSTNVSIPMSNQVLDITLDYDDPDILIQEGSIGKYSYRIISKRIN